MIEVEKLRSWEVKKKGIKMLGSIINIIKRQKVIIYIFLSSYLLIFSSSALYAGVGAAIEAKEHVDLLPLLKFVLVFLAGISAVFGLGLAFAAKKFAVKIDPRVEQVMDVLAHAHCGACGYAGCEQYAEAVVNNPDVPPNLCTPAGARGAEAVALITGKKAEIREPQFARIMCQGG